MVPSNALSHTPFPVELVMEILSTQTDFFLTMNDIITSPKQILQLERYARVYYAIQALNTLVPRLITAYQTLEQIGVDFCIHAFDHFFTPSLPPGSPLAPEYTSFKNLSMWIMRNTFFLRDFFTPHSGSFSPPKFKDACTTFNTALKKLPEILTRYKKTYSVCKSTDEQLLRLELDEILSSSTRNIIPNMIEILRKRPFVIRPPVDAIEAYSTASEKLQRDHARQLQEIEELREYIEMHVECGIYGEPFRHIKIKQK